MKVKDLIKKLEVDEVLVIRPNLEKLLKSPFHITGKINFVKTSFVQEMKLTRDNITSAEFDVFLPADGGYITVIFSLPHQGGDHIKGWYSLLNQGKDISELEVSILEKFCDVYIAEKK
jgi:hypothetical protein